MSFETFARKTAVTSGAVAGAAVGLYELGKYAYQRDLLKRLPEYGTFEPIFPYLESAMEAASDAGLRVELLGGPVKQALCDPETIIDPAAREIRVLDNPNCRVRKKGTLYRPDEFTLRDADIFAKAILIDGEWQPTLPAHSELLKYKTTAVQQAVDERAKEFGFPKGPEVSLFAYENPQGAFEVKHYATVTELEGRRERMSHSLGAAAVFEPQDDWTFIVEIADGEFRYPTTSPVRLLGRTLVRSVVTRDRDFTEVNEAVAVITQKGQFDELLGEEWGKYVQLRQDIDDSFKASRFIELAVHDRFKTAANLLLGKAVAPLASAIEGSYIGAMIRDPESFLYRHTSKIMGVQK